jgi:hypothetical protein
MVGSLTIIGHKIEPIYTLGNVFEIKVLKIPVRCWERHGDAVFRAWLILGQLLPWLTELLPWLTDSRLRRDSPRAARISVTRET